MTELMRVDRSAPTLRELTLEKLREAISTGFYRPGDRLVERTLCEQLGVSRTVVREVLRHLETEGLVETIAHQGPIVARLDPEQVQEIYEIRALLESQAARACAELATPGLVKQLRDIRKEIEDAFEKKDFKRVLAYTELFYEAMFAGGHKMMMHQVVKSLNARINQLRAMTIASPGRSVDSNREMNKLLAAIGKKDGDAAAAASYEHVRLTAAIAMATLAEKAAETSS
ncbi:GntR family transcriptional regulator [Caballeronia humi]|jgi:DNA-binding GntR family transcriptional regulator|uniref:GntR family transcriptional regulator n=2 Tax=Caballeronia humi TaxID=326474 RepID=A0A158JB97_9BURK|nr:GntR family transcriptional regulator [Caballeronia humi]SAL65955.1 GntR family transcriptional regulator [Caballeronia humi]